MNKTLLLTRLFPDIRVVSPQNTTTMTSEPLNATFNINASSFYPAPVNCSLFQSINAPLNTVPLITYCAVLLCQTFNLIGFRLWRHKQPFMRLHVALAVTSLLVGTFGAIAPLCRAAPWTPVTVVIAKLDVALFTISIYAATIITLCISADRWLSVEFPHRYRNDVSPRKMTVAIAASWGWALISTVPGLAIYREGIEVYCHRPFTVNFRINGVIDPQETFFASLSAGFFLLPILFIFQVRILIIAVETKLRLIAMRRQAVVPAEPASENAGAQARRRLKQANLAMRIVWGNLLASMTVVFGTVLAKIPYSFLPIPALSRATPVALIKLQNYLFTVSYLYTPFVYLIFFPQFRAAIKKPLVRGRDWLRGRLRIAPVLAR